MNRLELKTLELQEIQTKTIQTIADQFVELNANNRELISSIKELISLSQKIEPKQENKPKRPEVTTTPPTT